jgi:hypothetical protein
VRYVVLAIALTGCIDAVDARWQLDHDHVIAVRATPPRILPGQRAELEALVAHDGAVTAVEAPPNAALIDAPEALSSLLRFDGTRWFVEAPGEDVLRAERARIGFADNAAIPVDVYAMWPTAAGDPMYAKKTVWLGDTGANPGLPAPRVDGAPMSPEVIVPRETDVYLSVDVPATWRVSWLTSCGQLFQDDVATSFLRVMPGDTDTGELAVVIRDEDGGVAWDVRPIRAR